MLDPSNNQWAVNVSNGNERSAGIRTNADTQSYMTHLTRERLLTATEEIMLAERVQNGDKGAKDRLVEANMRLVINIARAHQGSSLPFEDLVQEGAVGLMTAADRFDPTKGCRFSTYATHWIKQSITRAIDNKSKPIRLPAHVSETLRKIERARAIWLRETGEDPSTEQLAEYLNVPIRKISALLHAALDPVSLDMQVGDEDSATLVSLLNDVNAIDPQARVLSDEMRKVLDSLLDILNPREQEVMRRRIGYEEDSSHVLQEIGSAMQISHERVRQIEHQAIRKLKFAARRRGLVTYFCG